MFFSFLHGENMGINQSPPIHLKLQLVGRRGVVILVPAILSPLSLDFNPDKQRQKCFTSHLYL